MKKALETALRKFVMVYIDDVIIYSKTKEEQLEHLAWVFEKLKSVDLRLGLDKCKLF